MDYVVTHQLFSPLQKVNKKGHGLLCPWPLVYVDKLRAVCRYRQWTVVRRMVAAWNARAVAAAFFIWFNSTYGFSCLNYHSRNGKSIISKHFVQGLGEQNNNILLTSVLTLAQALGLEVVAEGVEQQGQFAFLEKEGCNSLQGFFFARPEPQSKIIEKIRAGELKIH